MEQHSPQGPDMTNPLPPNPASGTWWEMHRWFRDLALCLALVTLVFVFVVRLVNVDGESMVPTLQHADKVALLSGALYSPQAGDIVVLRADGYDQPLVKRIIATEGQTVDIDFQQGIVYVDGVALDEPYIAEPTHVTGNVTFPQVVQEGCVFVMGDNRNNSSDSRSSRVGQVREENVLGKVVLVLWPLTHLGVVS